jgi:uncharacterized protein (DUF2141 family)
MKKLFILIICLLPFMGSYAQNTLEIRITGIRNTRGEILLQLYNDHHEIVSQNKGKIEGDKCYIKIENLKPGKYAVRYFHDENLSQKLEVSVIGIPKEGFGYSNNAAPKMGPPSFDKWIFDLNGNKKLELKITYL